MTDSPAAHPLTPAVPAPFISARQLCREYRLGRHNVVRALAGVDVDIQAGERVAILGKSGSGKSTLMNLLGGLDRPSSGTILVGGHNLGKLSPTDLATYRGETIGFVFQSFNLQPRFKAWENVALPLVFTGLGRAARRTRALELLDRVGLAQRADHSPSELSGGEQQRVAVARALVANPKLLLADEPTGNLDSNTSHQIMELLLGVNRAGTTLVMVTHDAELAQRYANRTLHMADGKMIADSGVSAVTPGAAQAHAEAQGAPR